MKIKSIKKIEYIGDVYNLRIKDGKNINNNYFANNLCVSNCHKAKAVTIKNILTRTFGHAQYRIGMSGTYPKNDSCEFFSIQDLIGPILLTVKAKELIDKGLISDVKIKALILQYEDHGFAENVFSIKKHGGGKRAYELEKQYVQNSDKRKLFLTKLVSKFKKNSLVLFHNIDYGTELYDFFRSNISGIDFYYIDGSTPSEKRSYIKKQMEDTSGNVRCLISSFGTTATGINIKAITNLVFADSFRSEQLIRQAVGRVLRLHKEKNKAIIFDIVDQFHHAFKNTLYNHYISRRDEIYKPQGFSYDELKIVL
jgi:superfamily II DNA or RNA helicase